MIQPGASRGSWRQRLGFGALLLSWGYLLVLIAVLAALQLAGDRWWPATLILYSPRGLLGLPLLVLMPAASALRRRALWPLGAALLLWLIPIMGLRIPLETAAAGGGTPLRVITWNLGQDRVDPSALSRLVRELDADIVMLQECPTGYQLEWPAEWHTRRAGQLVLASKHPLGAAEESRRQWPPSRWPPVNGLFVKVSLPSGQLGVACVHLLSPREGLAEILDRQTVVSLERAGKVADNQTIRQMESSAIADWLTARAKPEIVGGDFNMPIDSRIYRDAWSQYQNAFSRVGFGFGHTKFEPLGPFEYGIRIDHVLSTAECQFKRCWVGPHLGSDHRPLIVDTVWGGSQAASVRELPVAAYQ